MSVGYTTLRPAVWSPVPPRGVNISKLQKYTIALLFLTLLAGRFSLARVSQEFGDLGFIGEVRYWLFGGLVIMVSANLLKRRGAGPNKHVWRWVKWVALLHVYLAMSAFWAPEFNQAIEILFQLLLIIALLLMAAFLFSESQEKSIELCVKLFICAAFVYVLGGISRYWGDSYWGDGFRMAAFEGGANVFVRVMGSGLLAVTYLWAKTKRNYWLLFAPLFLMCAVLSGSRGGLIAITLGYLVFIALILRDTPRRLAGILLVIGLSSVLFSVSPVQETVATFWNERFVQQTFYNMYYSDRDVLFAEAWEMFVNQPIVGVGLNGFKYETITNEPYPHNLILSIASEGGCVGLVLFLISMVLLIARWFRPMALEHKVAFSLGILYFVANMFSGYYYDARFMWFFFLLYLMPCTADHAAYVGRFRGHDYQNVSAFRV